MQFESIVTLTFFSFGRNFAYSERITREHDRAAEAFFVTEWRERGYTTATGSVVLSIDWSAAFKEASKNTDLSVVEWMQLPKEKRPKSVNHPIRLMIRCIETTTSTEPTNPTHYVELALHEAFLVANISTPGAFSAPRVEMEHEGRRVSHRALNALFFEDSEYKAHENGWPNITPQPIERVAKWFEDLGVGTQQIASTKIAKALFSTLHVSQMAATEPAAVIWVSQCLESLYSVPTSLSFNYLVDRSQKLLGAPSRSSWARTEWRKFVDARNAFAHGGAEVVHPMANEVLEPRVQDFMWTWLDPCDFASSVVVATLQQYAFHRWRDVRWEDQIVPEILN
jgi:hypothetical protein